MDPTEQKERVLKFGGSSVSSHVNIWRVAQIIIDGYLHGRHLGIDEYHINETVVVSGFGSDPTGPKKPKFTDEALYAHAALLPGGAGLEEALEHFRRTQDQHIYIAKRLGLPEEMANLAELEALIRQQGAELTLDPRELSDRMTAFGEATSTPVIAEIVQRQLEKRYEHIKRQARITDSERSFLERLDACEGVYTHVVEPGDVGFITDSVFTDATLLPESLDTEIVRHYKELRQAHPERILFYPGFIAKDSEGRRTTLGRDGSNTTAVALLHATRQAGTSSGLIIYSDTDGVLIANPKLLGSVQTSRTLSIGEIGLITRWGGMPVFKAKPYEILKAISSPKVYVRNTFKPKDPGTQITPFSTSSPSRMKSVGVIDGITYYELSLEHAADFEAVRESITSYGARVMYSNLDWVEGKPPTARFVVQGEAKHREKKGTLVDYITAHATTTGKVGEEVFRRDNCSLVTICGEQIGVSHGDNIAFGQSIFDETIERALQGTGHSFDHSHRLPRIREDDYIQAVVPTDAVARIVERTHNQLKRTNVIIYGAGSVGLGLLKRIEENYSRLGLNVIGVADSRGTIFKMGGFSARDLTHIREKKEDGHAFAKDDRYIRVLGSEFEYIKGHNLRQVHHADKGDFVLVDATNNPDMIHTQAHALHLGMDVVSVNKTPYTREDPSIVGKTKRLYQAMFEDTVHIRGTVGANLGIPDAMLHKVLTEKRKSITIQGCFSGTLGYTLSELEQGKTLSQAIEAAVRQGYTEPRPFDDYSGQDVANKATILARLIATAHGVNFSVGETTHHSFLQPIIDKYNDLNDTPFDTSGIERLGRDEFVQKVKELDGAYEELKKEMGSKSLRYIATVEYDEELQTYMVDVRPAQVAKDSALGELQGTENTVRISVDGRSPRSYGIDPGPGAGIDETVDAIMNDLTHVDRIHRKQDSRQRVEYTAPERRKKGPRQREPVTHVSPSERRREKAYVQPTSDVILLT